MTKIELGPYALGPNENPENGIYAGDAMVLAEDIPDESVDLIFTDPVYWEIEQYQWLADLAARVLKPDRPCLVWTSQPMVTDCREVMAEALNYVYTLTYTVPAKTARLVNYHLFTWSTPCLWFNKGKFSPSPWVPDTVISSSPAANGFKWNKNPDALLPWTEGFSEPGSVILDPFTGSGTLPVVCKQMGRRYLAFEINADRAADARTRVHCTQPPLFDIETKQLPMWA